MEGLGFAGSLLMRLSDPIVIVGHDGTIRFANASFQTLSGWTTALTGDPVRDYIVEWDDVLTPLEETCTLATSLVRRSGQPLPIELVLSSWQTGSESLTGAIVRRLDHHAIEHDVAHQSVPMIRHHAQGEDRIAMGEERARLAGSRTIDEQASRTHKLLEEVVEMLPQAVCVFDREDRYVLWNHRYAELYPEIAGHLRVGIKFEDILRLSFSSGRMMEKASEFEAWLAQRLDKHSRPSWQEEQEFKDGRWILHDDRRLPGGGAIGLRIDITDIKRRESSFRLLFESNPVAMLVFDPGTFRILDVNDAACALYGRTRERFLTLPISALHEGGEHDAAAALYGTLVNAYEGRAIWHHLTADGTVLDVLIFIRASTHRDRPSFLAAVVDVSDRVRAEARIAHIAHHDPVTGLPNRIRFREVAQDALSRQSRSGDKRLVIHCLDLDGFKPVNDTYGHGVGDMLLKMVGERLMAAVRDDDLVARLGGDEFVILQSSGLWSATTVAARLIASLSEGFCVQGHHITVGASLGFAIASSDDVDLDQLIAAADQALYEAKAAGRGTWRAARGPARIHEREPQKAAVIFG